MLLDLLFQSIALPTVHEQFDRLFQVRGISGDPLKTVASTGSLELMGEIREALERLRAAFVQLRLHLDDLLLGLHQEFTLQFIEFEVHDPFPAVRRLHAVCRSRLSPII